VRVCATRVDLNPPVLPAWAGQFLREPPAVISSAGSLQLRAADAGEFLNRLYCNGFGKLPVGKARYGLMLREDGIVFDDGTTSRLAEDHFFMTTTTANAGRVISHIEFCHQVLWP